MKIDNVDVAIQKWWINEVVERRCDKFLVKIEDLFLIINSPTSEAGETFIETSRGKLRVFFSDQLPPDKVAVILHKSKWNYPRRGNPFRNMPDETAKGRERIN